MNFNLRQAKLSEINISFSLLKGAAETLAKKNINQWQYWKTPPKEKILWIEDGFRRNEFFFIEALNKEIMGMVRILDEDILYWGNQKEKARYVHSLIVNEKFSGNFIGTRVLKKIEDQANKDRCLFLRLDCDSTNKMLCNYYTNQGFIKVGSKKLPLSIYNLYQKKLI